MRRMLVMRVFILARNENLIIDDFISVSVIDIDDNNEEVMLEIDAPTWITVRKGKAILQQKQDNTI
jgi:sRNA-binding carbon storage regulator CsrA